MNIRLLFGLGMCLLLTTGCRSAYYSAWEKVGVHKRDLLKRKVVAARDDQVEASEQFKDALTRLKELTGFQGGNLEKTYNSLQSEYEKSASRAKRVNERVKEVETIASDLFKEWEKELEDITTASLRDRSRQQLQQTKDRYAELLAALKRAENSMEPVLVRLRDQVLFLKHNLNAEAVASLRGETLNIQQEISKLIEEMNVAIAQADKFIKTLE